MGRTLRRKANQVQSLCRLREQRIDSLEKQLHQHQQTLAQIQSQQDQLQSQLKANNHRLDAVKEAQAKALQESGGVAQNAIAYLQQLQLLQVKLTGELNSKSTQYQQVLADIKQIKRSLVKADLALQAMAMVSNDTEQQIRRCQKRTEETLVDDLVVYNSSWSKV